MRKCLWVGCAFVLGLAGSAMAQETPRVEVSGGYSYVRFNASAKATGLGGGTASTSVNMNGGSGSIAVNANDWLGLVADFGGYKNGNITNSAAPGGSADATIISYLFGPRLSYRKNATWTPFAQALFGGTHGNVSAKFNGASVGSQSQDKFALTVGGGLDAKVTDHIAIRIIQAEYFLTTFDAGKAGSAAGVKVNNQNNVRLTFGIVFRFGGTK